MREKRIRWNVFAQAVYTIALPIAFQNLLSTTASMVDTIMIGSMGELSVAAVGICSQISSLFFSCYFGFAGGALLFFSQYWGAKSEKGINKTFGLSMSFMLLVGLLFGAVAVTKPEFLLGIYTDKKNIIEVAIPYIRIVGFAYPLQVLAVIISFLMRATERVKIPLVSSAVALVVNFVLNWILIYGRFGMPQMGAAGAAGGTPGSANSSPDDEPEDPDRPDAPHKPGIPTDIIVLPNEIVFNELLPNPYPEGSEYIELYNRSDRTLSLAGLSVATRKSDGTLSTHYPLSSIVSLVEPQDYVLLTKSMGGVSDFYLISSPDALHELKLPVLANTSATLVLFRTEDEVMIDEIRYSSKWHAPSVKNEKGIALERINPDSDTQDEMNWTSASATAGYGTPGYRNSQYGKQDEGEVTGIEPPVYFEATKEYTISYHLDESGYTCRAWIFDISGRCISEVVNHDLLGIEGELTWNGLAVNGSKVRTGVYIFYAELVHPQGKIERYKEVFLVK